MKFGFRKPRSIAPAVQLEKSNPDEHGHPQACLNCGTALVGSYCHQCGQSAHTHRMSFKHFLLHDFVHGVWHLDKGFPATLKKAFVAPGKEIRNYLAGKRVGWFSILTMILLLYAAISFLGTFYDTESTTYENETSKRFQEFLAHYAKWLLLGLSFVCSWSSVLVFRRARLNLSEHTIINCFFLIGILSIFLMFIPIEYDSPILDFTPPASIAVYLAYGYYGAFRRHYTLAGFSWRILVHGVLSCMIAIVGIAGIVFTIKLMTGEKKFEFGFEKQAPAALKSDAHQK